MLPIAERLKRPGLFTRAYGARKSVNTSIFTLYVLPRQSPFKQVFPLVGFVVSKKISKSACRRNRMKRRLREAYRHICTADSSIQFSDVRQSLHKWYAMVLVIKAGALTTPWSEVCRIMENAFLEATRRYG